MTGFSIDLEDGTPILLEDGEELLLETLIVSPFEFAPRAEYAYFQMVEPRQVSNPVEIGFSFLRRLGETP